MAKPRKKYRPKYVAKNPISTFFGGMGSEHRDHLQELHIKNHIAMANLAKGEGKFEDFDRVAGAMNVAWVMCTQGIWADLLPIMQAAKNALGAMQDRVREGKSMLFTVDELRIVNEAMEYHDAQLDNCRYIDVDKAASTAENLIRDKIAREIKKAT